MVATLIIIGMVVTQTFIMRLSVRTSVNWVEFICVRLGFSIYNGWVTTATILNFFFVAKSIGSDNTQPPTQESLLPRPPSTYEVEWSVIILYVAEVLYITVTVFERNPIYGAVWCWVLFNIRDFSKD